MKHPRYGESETGIDWYVVYPTDEQWKELGYGDLNANARSFGFLPYENEPAVHCVAYVNDRFGKMAYQTHRRSES